MKRSKSNGLKSRKRPGKKSGNAKKMRKTRKNKGGTYKEAICKGNIAMSGTIAGLSVLTVMTVIASNPATVPLLYGAAGTAILSGTALTSGVLSLTIIGALTGQTDLDCNSIDKSVFKSLNNITLAKKNKEEGKGQAIEIKVISNNLFGQSITDKTYTLVHIRHGGMKVNKDEYYLFDGDTLDVLRSIAFTHMNRYISKYGIISERKYHVIKALIKYNANDLYKKVDKYTKYDGPDEEKKKFTENIKNIINSEKDQVVKYWNIFRSAALYFCNEDNYYKNRTNLKNACGTSEETTEETTEIDESEFKEITDTVKKVMFTPIVEHQIYKKEYEGSTN